MPRYKILSEGESVRLDVEVVFESIKMQGQYLHTGNELPPELDETLYEVDLSVSPSAFFVLLHHSHKQANASLIQVGLLFSSIFT